MKIRNITACTRSNIAAFAALLTAAFAATSPAHDGRRMEILVEGGQLVARGYISNGIDDGGGVIRPYSNAIHGHWSNAAGAVQFAFADLPGFDVFDSSESFVGGGSADLLAGHDITLTLQAGMKWANPPAMGPFGAPGLVPLGPGETITISDADDTVDTDSLGSIVLAQGIAASGAHDLDLDYQIAARPSGVIYALLWTLSTDAPGIADSATIYTFLSPDPTPNGEAVGDPMIGLHHASLHAEETFGTPVPEPSAGALVALAAAFAAARRRGPGRVARE